MSKIPTPARVPTPFLQALMLKTPAKPSGSEPVNVGPMSNQNLSQMSVRKFDGKNFLVWKAQMEAYLTIKECMDVVTTDRPRGTQDEKLKAERAKLQAEWDQKNTVARAIILQFYNCTCAE